MFTLIILGLGMAAIAAQHLAGWPTLASSAEREAEKRDKDIGRAAAVKLGAA